MTDSFYRGSPHAVKASKPEMLEHAEELRRIIAATGNEVELIAVNELYKRSFVGRALSGYGSGQLHCYTVIPYHSGMQVRREYEFRGIGGDIWEQAPNYVQLKDLELGQMELF